MRRLWLASCSFNKRELILKSFGIPPTNQHRQDALPVRALLVLRRLWTSAEVNRLFWSHNLTQPALFTASNSPLHKTRPNFMKFCVWDQLAVIITRAKFLANQFRSYGVATPQNRHFPQACCITSLCYENKEICFTFSNTAVTQTTQFSIRV